MFDNFPSTSCTYKFIVLSTPIWYHKQIVDGKIESSLDKGSLSIGDLLDKECQMYSIDHIRNGLQ